MEKPTNSHSKSKIFLALVLAITMAARGCSSQWINIALQDLPVLTQMALNIAVVVSTLASGNQASTADSGSSRTSRGKPVAIFESAAEPLQRVQANLNGTTLQKIQNVISDLNQNLPALLESAHIGNPVLSARITAAVNLILTTVDSFAGLIPQTAPSTSQKAHAGTPPPRKT